ncbi:transcriptional regulator [Planomonospora sphaerica]|uniref:Transcriptional regulator WhiB n=1 Tax=Planomonospora sphaerica TaxID=161355 RepID=A0A171D928_9ACTN|nr:WhiB family transcriptional regulator [Planomonospora sphaerica]GAT67827.1 transcriptional regulator [Planomonospora sphaerica]
MTRPLRTVSLLPTPSGNPVRPERYHLARLGTGEITSLRNALIDSAPACESTDADLFTGPDAFTEEPASDRMARETEAKALCFGCPARTACLAYALAIRPTEGVWAGFTATEVLNLAAYASATRPAEGAGARSVASALLSLVADADREVA